MCSFDSWTIFWIFALGSVRGFQSFSISKVSFQTLDILQRTSQNYITLYLWYGSHSFLTINILFSTFAFLFEYFHLIQEKGSLSLVWFWWSPTDHECSRLTVYTYGILVTIYIFSYCKKISVKKRKLYTAITSGLHAREGFRAFWLRAARLDSGLGIRDSKF